MNNKEKIMNFLNDKNAKICDDCLSLKTDIKPRQQINQIANELYKKQIILRNIDTCDSCKKNKTINYLSIYSPINKKNNDKLNLDNDKPWYWEGNVQESLVEYLTNKNIYIKNTANTLTRETGKDIEAILPDNTKFWISVKGFPEKSKNTQARHWFSQAIFDMIIYHGEDSKVKLGIAFPNKGVTYKNLIKKIEWFLIKFDISIFWVCEDGEIITNNFSY